jgi:cyclohexanone monooxygenase
MKRRCDGSNVDGKARSSLVYGGGLVGFAKFCDEVAAKGYEGYRLSE